MKIYFPLWLFLFLLQFNLHSQTFEAGLVVGAAMTQIDGDDLWGYNKIGFVGGAKVDVQLSTRWRAGFELLYSQMGASAGRYDDPFAFYDKIRLNYVEVPVSLIFKDWLIDGEYFRLGFLVGMSYARLINFKTVNMAGLDVTDNEDLNPNAILGNFGVIYHINKKFALQGHWSRSFFMDVNNQDKAFVLRNITFKGLYYF